MAQAETLDEVTMQAARAAVVGGSIFVDMNTLRIYSFQ
eukprot:SAG31_NODE_2342_length_5912_cov_1.363152_8_plen_38_part_00